MSYNYQPQANYLARLTSEQSISDFIPLVNEQIGGIEIYVHSSISPYFCTYLAWEKPTMNTHVDSVEHEEWEGWMTRGWDSVEFSTLKENLEVNQLSDATLYDLQYNGMTVAKTTFESAIEAYLPLLVDFFAHIERQKSQAVDNG